MIHKKSLQPEEISQEPLKKNYKKISFIWQQQLFMITMFYKFFLLHIFVVLPMSPVPSPIYSTGSYECVFLVFSCCLQKSMKISN